MPDREKVIRKLKEALENAENEGEIFAEVRRPVLFDALALLNEQEAEIRQLRLALDIAKGTCKGIVTRLKGGD